MGINVYVYRNPLGDCTNNGVSARFTNLCVVNVDGPFEPDEDTPAVRLIKHHRDCLSIVPVAEHNAGKWLSSGGNFAYTSDSRFSAKCEQLLGHSFYGAVSIHDRIE